MKEAMAKGFPLITHQNHGYNLDFGHQNPSKSLVVFEIQSWNPANHNKVVYRYNTSANSQWCHII